MLFDFLSMGDNYEERKVGNFQEGELTVDTCAVTDSDQPFETGVCHPSYNDGDWIIVELYNTKEDAQKGHERWVKKMTAKNLPEILKDVATAETAKLKDGIAEEDWRSKEKD